LGPFCGVAGLVCLGVVSEPGNGPFVGLDVGGAVELGELLAFLGDWLASDPNRLDASLYEFVGVSTDFGSSCSVEELRAEVNRFADMLSGYTVASGGIDQDG
jgi:hypothetical protein